MDRRIAAGIFILGLATFSWFYGGDGWNQGAQLDLTRAIVERHTLYIDGYDGNTRDVSIGSGGHKYINRAPGVSFLAVLPYVVGRGDPWFCSAATCGVCGALIGAILYLYGRRRYDAAPRDALAISLAILFGTIVFAYSTMLFVHVPAALFLLLAVVLLDRHPFAAGLAAGMATLCFYVCGAAALLLAVLRPNRRFLLGGAPFAVVLGAYQWACFGSPFRTAVESSVYFRNDEFLFGVLHAPSLRALWAISVSPYRGLFFVSPFLLFAFSGFRRMARRDAVAVAVIAAIFVAVIAGFNGWNGGWAFGPRYLLPIIPLLGMAMLAGARTARRTTRAAWIAAVVVSVAINFLAVAVDPMPPDSVRSPTIRDHIPGFFQGRLSQGINEENVGERIFGTGTRASVAPVALWLIAGAAVLVTLAREPSPRPSLQPRTR
ncbi:MAG TPA: hypothetical protein VG323_18930 [Thermoanaerobaculia bacterium]|nr:hypothetical protein [Thermoanaerobaculia bacterium]